MLINIRAGPRLSAELRSLARGRAIVIDYFASGRCGVVVGDITADFAPPPPTATHSEVRAIDGVRVFAERRLVPLLEETAVTLDLRRLPFGRRLGVMLDRPERWLDFLERPGICGRHPANRHAH